MDKIDLSPSKFKSLKIWVLENSKTRQNSFDKAEDYFVNGLSIVEIAEKHSVSRQSVDKIVHKFNDCYRKMLLVHDSWIKMTVFIPKSAKSEIRGIENKHRTLNNLPPRSD